MKKQQAKKLSIVKWEAIVKNNGKELNYKQLTELGLTNLFADCGYCEKYLHDLEDSKICRHCPLNAKKLNIKYDKVFNYGEAHCLFNDHPYNIWQENQTVENAERMLNLIIKS